MTPQRNTGAGAEAELPEYAGHYRLEERLGAGGMGVVHLARSTSGMKVAVKVVHAQFARDPEFRGRFRQEVAAARRVSGAFTAPVVDADPEAERPWMATLFIPGSTLAEQVKRNGPMRSGELRRLMAGLAEALRDIHRVGVVHRDLKPSNVLLAEDGPKVIDFGISRPKDSELRTETGKLIGTPPFMAPEQFRRPREVGPAADIFALGSVMVHAATGRGPFDSDSPYVVAYQVVHDEPDLTGVPGNLAPLVARCLAKEPEDRPTPDELMRELRSEAASYDTQAFIPAQRTLEESGHESWHGQEAGQEAGLGPESGSKSGSESGSDSGSGSGSGSGSAEVTSRRRRRRVALAAGALVVVLSGGALAVTQVFGDADVDARGNSGASESASAASASWNARPADGGDTGTGSGTGGMPQCAYDVKRLLCVQAGLVSALDPSDGRVLWRHALAGDDRPSEAPVLAGGLAQVLTHAGKRVEALDPASGATRWQRDVSAYQGVRSAGGTLLLTSADGTVTGVDAATGKTAWSLRVPGVSEPYFLSFPKDPLAYAVTTSDSGTGSGTGTVSDSDPGGGHTRITAVDPATGTVRWEERLGGSLTLVGTTGDSLVLLSQGSAYGTVDAVVRYRPADRVARRVTLDVGLQLQQGRAAVQGDRVYLLAFDGALVAVDTAARKQVWSLQTAVSRGSVPSADGDHVYFSAPDGRLLAVDAARGKLVGQTRLRLGANSDEVVTTLPAPIAIDGRVYAGAPDGTVFAVDGRDPAGW
ncbi:serine/threonine protein kinase [Streptomyces sp. yr375]|uniref:serine/threonine-protein kinase n=1 Tax=Streptomyces sp. yr375 TaxID=1761906 RepID=UPI0008C892A6|nr:serine/threonine-protein kinase [Streptomyces sp. yr375]SES17745.1 serine/threonine protein kinase [Streptomyces sp. yr375]